MNKRQAQRMDSLLPGGIPRYVRCYDNGGESADRYIVVYSGHYPGRNTWCQYVTMSKDPYCPQGVCLHGESLTIIDRSYAKGEGRFRDGFPPAVGRKHPFLGKRIPFEELPPDCQKVVLQDYRELWSLPSC